MRLGLYVHIPFCRHKCLYCDFPSYAGLERYYDGYVQALCRDIAASPYAGEEADTIYIGGGTPSLLAAGDIDCILKALRQTFRMTSHAEITVEANPDSLDYDKAAALADSGVNRLSLGIQSFSDAMLAFLGRVHTAAQGEAAILAAYDAGIHNLSLDLMYGLPHQGLADVCRDVKRLSQLPVVHASIYSLIVEDGTQLKAGLDKGEWQLPPDEATETMARTVHEAMHVMVFITTRFPATPKALSSRTITASTGPMSLISASAYRLIPSMGKCAGRTSPISRLISARPARGASLPSPSPSTRGGPSKITASWPYAAASASITAIMPAVSANPLKPTSAPSSISSSARAF